MIDVKGAITLDEPSLMLEAVRNGLGLAYLTEWNVSADLVRVLADWTPAFGDLCLYYPGRRNIPAGLRAPIDLIGSNCNGDSSPMANLRTTAAS